MRMIPYEGITILNSVIYTPNTSEEGSRTSLKIKPKFKCLAEIKKKKIKIESHT